MSYSGNFAFLDEQSKKEIRRATLKAVSIPGYQVSFASRELPIARGWGTGGLQLSLSLIGKKDTIKVVDQGSDESVNAVNIRKLIQDTTGVPSTIHTREATIIQSRHRIPEVPLKEGQILVLQVPIPEPLRLIEPSDTVAVQLHANAEYGGAWLHLFDQIVRYGYVAMGADYPVMVHQRYLMAPSPIPRYDNPKLHQNEALILLGAGREKKIYAIPPFTNVVPIDFEDVPFEVESFANKTCKESGLTDVFMDEIEDEKTGEVYYLTNDTSYMLEQLNGEGRANQ
jgi:alpha-D-ribose 1-methylphosphonate 5-phosphate C-P lyase